MPETDGGGGQSPGGVRRAPGHQHRLQAADQGLRAGPSQRPQAQTGSTSATAAAAAPTATAAAAA